MAASRAPTLTTERAIHVTGIPHVTDDARLVKDKLIEYFGESRCGGGDIENVICPVSGLITRAIVIFNSKEVPKTVIEYGVHTFEKHTINVKTLPSVFTHIDVEVDKYYRDIIPRDNATHLVSSLKTTLGDKNVSGEKHVIDKLTGSLDQLKEAKQTILASAGIVCTNTAGIIAKSVEVNKIPFVTDDGEELKNYMIDDITCNGTIKVEKVITRVRGNIHRAIIVFVSNKDKEKYVQQSSHRFRDEELSIKILPKVYRNATATLDDFYIECMPRLKIKAFDATVKEKCGSDVTLIDKKLLGAFEQLTGAMNILLETTGLSPTTRSNKLEKAKDSENTVETLNYSESESWVEDKHDDMKGESLQNTTDVDDNIAGSIYRVTNDGIPTKLNTSKLGKCKEMTFAGNFDNSQSPLCTPTKVTELTSTEENPLEDHTIDNYVSVDAITFAYIKKTASEKLNQISQRFNVAIDIQTPDSTKPTELVAHFNLQKKENVIKSCDENLSDAMEEFIKLYQDVFYSVKRVSLKYDDLSEERLSKALKVTEKQVRNIVIYKDKHEYIVCGADNLVAEAMKVFRETAGIQPITRRLRHNVGDSTTCEPCPKPTKRWIEPTKVAKSTRSLPGNLASIFYTNEGLEIVILEADITKQHVDIIVNAANGQLQHSGGLALAISRAAGKQLQSDCNKIMKKRHQDLGVGECIETKGYNLHCQHIIHAVGPKFEKYGDRPSFFTNLDRTFMNVLNLANKIRGKTIAIPLISSGNFGGPKECCTGALTNALCNFSSSPESKELKQICLVNVDNNTTRALQQQLAEVFPTRNEIEDTHTESHDFNQPKGNAVFNFKTIEGIEVVVLQGDITKGRIEVIVNAANGQLRHGGGVAGAIARAAGNGIRNESSEIIRQRGSPLQVGECVMTGGYNLKCQVIHAVGPIFQKYQSEEMFFKLLKKTFLQAIRFANLPVEAKEVVIPLISSGIYGGPKSVCAKALAEAVHDFSVSERNLIIRRLYLVNVDDETTKAVRVAIERLFSIDPVVKPTDITISPDSTDCDNQAVVSEPLAAAESKEDRIKAKNLEYTSKTLDIIALTGDISKQSVDVIVNNTDSKLNKSGDISQQLSQARIVSGGSNVQKLRNANCEKTTFRAVTEKSYEATDATGKDTQQSLESKEKTQMTKTNSHQDKTHYDLNVDSLSTGSKNNVNLTSATPKMSRTRQTRMCQTCHDLKKKLYPLESCQHKYCFTCIRDIVIPANACQVCRAIYGAVTEGHLNGTMTYYEKKDVTPKGSKTPGVICMKYDIPHGVQKTNHPRPDRKYFGLKIEAYLPTNTDGHEVLHLLKEAFIGGHLFQINSCKSKKRQTEQVALADIPLKTKVRGGSQHNGYPDQDYLPSIKKILQEKGINVHDGSVV